MKRALVALAATTFVLGPVVSASAQSTVASITDVGWWSQRPGAAPLPKGSFEIALLPNAPQSVAALRINVTRLPLASALIELTESQQFGGDVARIDACPTSDQWAPSNPGAWADAPTASCTAASVALGRTANGTWTADIASLLRAGTNSVVLAPILDVSDAQQSAAFQVVFSGARITADATTDPGITPPGPVDNAPVVEPAPSFAPGIPAGPVALPTGPVIAGASPAPATPDTQDAPAVAAGDDDGEARPWWRLLYGVPLSVLAGVGAIFLRRVLQQRGLIGG